MGRLGTPFAVFGTAARTCVYDRTGVKLARHEATGDLRGRLVEFFTFRGGQLGERVGLLGSDVAAAQYYIFIRGDT